MSVSVLLPSRGRPDSLRRSCESLLSLAHNQDQVEILVGFDDDDPETGRVAHELGFRSIESVRHGYSQLHLYVNQLAELSTGDWLFLWNDDAVMETLSWDRVLSSYDSSKCLVLSPSSTVVRHSMCCFPIISRGLYSRLGHMSLSPHIDTWLQDLGNQTRILRNISVSILHDRFDLTGGHEDVTWIESQAGYRTEDFYSERMQSLLRQDIAKVVRC